MVSSDTKDALIVTTIKGNTAWKCGVEYGQRFSTLIRGFIAQEVTPTKEKIMLARQCYALVTQYAPVSAFFMKGIAKGCGLPLDAVAVLSLHEEFYHRRSLPSHCTAISALPKVVKGAKTIIGQNWDWQPQLYPWPGLLRLSIKGSPTVLAYHYPGLWNCCGVNSKGLALMWTGAGYFPPLAPTKGLPTYVMVSEVMRKNTLNDALSFLKATPRAGCFIFVLADALGRSAVVEATPSSLAIEKGTELLYRANLYVLPETKKASHQERPSKKKHHSVIRMCAIERFIKNKKGKLDIDGFKRILSDPNVFVDRSFRSMTVDQFIAVCEDRSLYVRRGGHNDSNRWIKHKI